MDRIVIIGNGIAGITAARHIRKQSDKEILIISDESDHFFSRTALMYVYMGHMRWKDLKPYEDWFWSKNRLQLKRGRVTHLEPGEKQIHLKDGERISYDSLILATGSVTNTFGWPGLELDGVLGLVHKQDLEALEQWAPNKDVCPRAVIVGGGLIGVELAEMLHTRGIAVTFLVREPAFWTNVLPDPEAGMISRHIRSHGIDLRHEANLDKILGDEHGRVRAVLTKEGEEIPCNLVGITTGVRPNIDWLKNSELETDKGILVDRQLRTNLDSIYAIGDCAQQRDPVGLRPAVEAVWYTGRIMGETVARTICGYPTSYQPGPWFNSAKFFDIEYQTYGWVYPRHRKRDFEEQFHWKHPDDTKSITISFHRDTRQFLGINTFGIRLRHPLMDKWLREGRKVEDVLSQLKDANFDPEFYARYEADIISAYNSQYGTDLRLRPASKKRFLFS